MNPIISVCWVHKLRDKWGKSTGFTCAEPFGRTGNKCTIVWQISPNYEVEKSWCKWTARYKKQQKLSAWEGWTCNENAKNSRANPPRLISLLVLLFKDLLELKTDPFFNECLDTSTGVSTQNCLPPGFPGSLLLLRLAQKHTSMKHLAPDHCGGTCKAVLGRYGGYWGSC